MARIYDTLSEEQKNKNNTDFEIALSQNNLERAVELIQSGVNVSMKFDKLIGDYCEKGNVDIVKLLLSHCNPSTYQIEFYLNKCISNNNVDLTHYLIDDYLTHRLHTQPSKKQNIFQKFKSIFNTIFSQPVTAKDEKLKHWTPQDIKCTNLDFYEICIPGNLDTLKILIDKFGPLTEYDYSLLSTRTGHANDILTLKYLVESNPQFSDHTEFVYYAAIDNDNIEMVEYLDTLIQPSQERLEDFFLKSAQLGKFKCLQYFAIEKNVNISSILEKKEHSFSPYIIDWAKKTSHIQQLKNTLNEELLPNKVNHSTRLKI